MTSGDAVIVPSTSASSVVVYRLLPAGYREFAACSPPAARRAWWCRVADAFGAVSSATGRRARGGQPEEDCPPLGVTSDRTLSGQRRADVL